MIMRTRIPILLTIVIFSLSLVLISCFTPAHPHPADSSTVGGISKAEKKKKQAKLVARDVITLTIIEAKEIWKFINKIPRLNSIQAMETPPRQLLSCVESLIDNISQVRFLLNRLRHLRTHNPSMLLSDAYSLQNMTSSTTLTMGGPACQYALKDVDTMVTVVLNRKLVDMALLIDEVVYRVSQFEQLVNKPRAAAAAADGHVEP